MRNNNSPKLVDLQKNNVVYKFECPLSHCNVTPYTYVGMATISLLKRLTLHIYSGSIKEHFFSITIMLQ